MVHQTQPSAEPAEEPPPGYDMKNVQKFHDEQKSEKTDLRSVQDLKFAYNPKNPLGDVKKPERHRKSFDARTAAPAKM
ncbi:hypothetical protein Q1695_008009 [Nippostrongylus brasiliensis]|nr:hypothetical protein Q1695_008009 [Nippostrongylus brasiliensis]